MIIYKLSQKEFDSLNLSLSKAFDVAYQEMNVGDQIFETSSVPSSNCILRGESSPRWRKKHSEESKKKMAAARLGKKATDETRKKMSLAQLGKKQRPESIVKMLETRKGKPAGMKGKKKITTVCPHCGLIGARSSLKRYHFDNCKSLRNS